MTFSKSTTARRSAAQVTCHCDAYTFPHRQGSGRCHGDQCCEHGIDRSEERCPDCDRWDRVDWAYDSAHDR